MLDVASWSTWAIAATFGAMAVVIGVVGTRLTGHAEKLSRETGLGQAVFGAVFLGGATSLPGLTTSVSAAFDGHAALAVSNGIGGIAAQTVFLAVADVAYREANLEHAAANVANLMQGALLVTLSVLPILAMTSPGISFWGIHPVTPALAIAYVLGIRMVGKARTEPMWSPRDTEETADEQEEEPRGDEQLWKIWLAFGAQAVLVGGAGYVVAGTGFELAERTGLSESVVGTFLTASTTSLPELVTAVAAVRRGALTLAVGDVLGGNCFDILFVAASDVAYREGSIYSAIGTHETFVIALTVLLTGILLLGLLRRERHGIANIGFESFLVICLYIGAFLLLMFG